MVWCQTSDEYTVLSFLGPQTDQATANYFTVYQIMSGTFPFLTGLVIVHVTVYNTLDTSIKYERQYEIKLSYNLSMWTIFATGYKMDKTFIITISEKAQNALHIPVMYIALVITAAILSAYYYVIDVMSCSILCYRMGATKWLAWW